MDISFEARLMVTQPDTVFQNVQSNSEEEEAIGDHIKMALLKDVRRRMTPQPLKILAEVEITCFEYDGIEHIKAALKTAEKFRERNVMSKFRWLLLHSMCSRHRLRIRIQGSLL